MRSLLLRFGWFPLLAAASGLGACGGGHDELSKRLATVQADLIKVQAHSDRLEQRLGALEMRKESAPPVAQAGESAANRERPPLMVVKLEPGDETREAPDAPRPRSDRKTLRPTSLLDR